MNCFKQYVLDLFRKRCIHHSLILSLVLVYLVLAGVYSNTSKISILVSLVSIFYFLRILLYLSGS